MADTRSGTRIGPETVARIASVWPELLADIADAMPVNATLAKYGLSASMVRAYRARNIEADKEWQVAREHCADALMAQLIETANNGDLDPAHARVKCDVLKWAICKYNPKLYGDKSQIDVNVRHIDLTAIIQAANARVAHMQGRTIEGERLPALAELLA